MPTSIQFSSPAEPKPRQSSIYTRPQKKQKMSITQTYFLAHSARGKLSKEASRGDHDLRLLVGHANLLDTLMLDLANAEQEQETWFNNSLSGAKESEEESFHVENAVVSEPEADWEADDAESSDSESEADEEENLDIASAISSSIITTTELDSSDDEEDEDFEDDETFGDLALTRTPSRHNPPELSSDSESDSEDEHMPPSPPQATFDAFTPHQKQAITTTSFYDKASSKEATLSESQQETFIQEGFFLPARQEQPALIAAF